MQVLNPRADVDAFFERLAGARQRLLLVDYDGTVAPFHPSPERAIPYPRVAQALNRICRAPDTRVVMVSGRRLSDLRGALATIRFCEAWAAHGWQRFKAGGERFDFQPPYEAHRQLHLAEARARQLRLDGARIELKLASVAVHWRGLTREAVAPWREELIAAWNFLDWPLLELMEFDGGIELRIRGRSKGDAVRQVLAESGPGAVCAYLGDDRTDEDAFAALNGQGLAVLVRPSLRQTRADLWLAPPRELTQFLERWCTATEAAA
jgi:trehalose 6-phosphate phosphatase